MHSSPTYLQKGCVHPSHVVMHDNLPNRAVGSSIWPIQQGLELAERSEML